MVNYGTIYTLPFKSRKEVSYLIEIQKENYTGDSVELVGSGSSPFSVSIEDEDFLYIPTRFSKAVIRVVGGDYLQSLYSTGYQQYRVNFKRENNIVWTGFVKPELYTQDYTSTKFELEIDCISAMGTLEYINYKQGRSDTRSFISIWELLKMFISESRGCYSSVFIPHVYAKDQSSYNKESNVLKELTISEQNFFDEDDKAMTLKEVLEETCKFLNWTCVDWLGNLYFVDVDHKGTYHEYNLDMTSFTQQSPNRFKVSEIGYAGSEHFLDILPGYNKTTIKCSNYCYNDIISEEEFKKLSTFAERKTYNYKQYYETRQYLKSKVFKLPRYENLNDNKPYCNLVDESVTNVYIDEPTQYFLGGYCAKRCEYEVNDGKPNISDYNWEYLYQFKLVSDYNYTYPSTVPPTGDEQENPDWKPPMITVPKQLGTGSPLLKFKDNKPIKYFDGAFGISMSYSHPLNASNMTSYEKYNSGGVFGTEIACRLIVGDYYYTNNGWVKSANKPTGLDLTFDLDFKLKKPDEWVKNENTKTLSMPYEGLTGYVIEIPNNINLFGQLEFEILKKVWLPEGVSGYGFFLKDIKIDFKKKVIDNDNIEENNSDRIYENVVNESYINPLDEIEFKISSYNNDGACYSKVMLGSDYLRDNLYSSIENALVRPEEQLIRRIINQYGATKIKLTQVLKNSESITPISVISDNYMNGKNFIVTGGEIDFAAEQFTCKMIQTNGYTNKE